MVTIFYACSLLSGNFVLREQPAAALRASEHLVRSLIEHASIGATIAGERTGSGWSMKPMSTPAALHPRR
jgi:hypothetical protein